MFNEGKDVFSLNVNGIVLGKTVMFLGPDFIFRLLVEVHVLNRT